MPRKRYRLPTALGEPLPPLLPPRAAAAEAADALLPQLADLDSTPERYLQVQLKAITGRTFGVPLVRRLWQAALSALMIQLLREGQVTLPHGMGTLKIALCAPPPNMRDDIELPVVRFTMGDTLRLALGLNLKDPKRSRPRIRFTKKDTPV